MADATLVAQSGDTITAVDLVSMTIFPLLSNLSYSLRETWASGKVTTRDGFIDAAHFAACIASWTQATPKRKFLTWLAANGFETNLTPV